MKSHGKLSIGSFGLVIFAAFFFVASAVLAKEGPNGKKGQRLNMVAGNPASTIININNITAWMQSDALYPPDVGGSWIGEFPRLSTVGIIYQEGIVFGGFVNDGGTPTLRVGGTTYPTGMQPGKILQNSSGVTTGAEDPNSPNVTRIWRVRPDVYPGQPANSVPELTTDAATWFQVKTTVVTQAQKDEIQQQYYTDWKEWPADKGAPWFVDTVGAVEYNDASHSYDPNNPHDIPGIPGASQTIWLVCNDLNTGLVNTLYGSPPIGIEEQQTIWAYSTSTPLNNIYFKHVKLIYDGTANSNPNSEIDSMYVVQWRDPDNGDSGDDFSGSDSTLSLGFCYNGEPVDAKYAAIGLPPAASGAVFLQGPSHYTGDPADSAVVDFVWRHGYAYWHPRALTGFDYFAAGTSINDPTLGGDYTGTEEFFNLMRGDLPDPAYPAATPFWQSSTYASAHNIVTNYMLNGDPVTHSGWVDGYDVPMGDRRDVNVSGPFTLKLHDTVDIVVAMVGGLGTNYISSVSVLEYNTTFAHYAFNNLFKLPSPPPSPQVTATALNDTVVLNWGTSIKSVETIESSSEAGFSFEGYNVYQLPSPSSSIADGVRIATYDLKDGILTVLDNAVDPTTGVVITKPSEFGTDSGIQRFITVTKDHLRSVPLVDGQNYYFAVTAYTVNIDPSAPFHALESAPVVLTVQPHSANPGYMYSTSSGDTLSVKHVSGISDGVVMPLVVDPNVLTGDNYEVRFSNPTDSSSSAVATQWSLYDATKNSTVYSSTNLTGSTVGTITDTSNYYPVVQGMQLVVSSPPAGINSVSYTGTRWVSGTNWGGSQFFGGMDLGANFFGSDLPNSDYVPVLLKFVGGANAGGPGSPGWSQGAVYRRDKGYAYQGVGWMPFTAWDISDPNNPRQINASFVEDSVDGNANMQWDMGWNGSAFAANGGREYIFINYTSYDPTHYNATIDGETSDVLYAIWPAARGAAPYLQAPFTITIVPNYPVLVSDKYTFAAPAVTQSTVAEKADVKKVNVFPNPYYGFQSRETNSLDKQVTFNHLPTKATIRIYNLAGILVRTIYKDDATQFAYWDLRNQGNLPVASGVYIVYVDMGQIGSKILKLALVQQEQVLPTY